MIIEKVKEMFEMQASINEVVEATWKTAGRSWERAMLVECAETYEHLGFKWWKKAKPLDITQIHIELVDIFHFLLSRIIEDDQFHQGLIDESMKQISMYNEYADTNIRLLHHDLDVTKSALGALDDFIEAVVLNKMSESRMESTMKMVRSFMKLCYFTGLDFDRLYTLYIGKNALNTFRQRNGYKTGKYIKNWSQTHGEDLEDNVALERVIAGLGNVKNDLFNLILLKLALEYSNVLRHNTEIQVLDKGSVAV